MLVPLLDGKVTVQERASTSHNGSCISRWKKPGAGGGRPLVTCDDPLAAVRGGAHAHSERSVLKSLETRT